MKINEIIIEGKTGKIPKRSEYASKGEWSWRDDGIDRIYNLNRVMMAAAKSDGVSTKAVDVPEQSWFGKHNIARPYTEQEHIMMQSAFNTIDSEIRLQPTHINLTAWPHHCCILAQIQFVVCL